MEDRTGTFSAEQLELQSTVRRFCAERYPSAHVRALMDGDDPVDRHAHAEIGGLGWLGLAMPERYGGQGAGFLEQGLVLEQLGYALAAPQVLTSAVCAATAILEAGSEAQKAALLPRIVDGTMLATVAVPEDGGGWDADAVTTSAARTGEGWQLDGVKRFVWDGPVADLLVVAARTPDRRVALFAVEGGAEGLTRVALEPLDRTRRVGHLGLRSTPAIRLGSETTDGEAALRRVREVSAVGLACEMLGGAQWCLDTAVAYARSRHQFGRPIGTFQAVKHRCADMLTQVEMARSAAYSSAAEIARGGSDLPLLAPLAKAACGDAYYTVSCDAIQIHGALGYTWEHDAHLHVRRARSAQVYLGDPDHQRERVLAHLGI